MNGEFVEFLHLLTRYQIQQVPSPRIAILIFGAVHLYVQTRHVPIRLDEVSNLTFESTFDLTFDLTLMRPSMRPASEPSLFPNCHGKCDIFGVRNGDVPMPLQKFLPCQIRAKKGSESPRLKS